MSNFIFLNNKWPNLAKIGEQAEKYLSSDPNASMLKSRFLGEKLIDLILATFKITVDKYSTQDDKIKFLGQTTINKSIPLLLDIVRRLGNKAAHDGYDDYKSAKESLISILKATAWFYIKITKDKSILPLKFVLPTKSKIVKTDYTFAAYKKEAEETKRNHEDDLKQVSYETSAKQEESEVEREQLKQAESTLELNEEETRKQLINLLLTEADWNIEDTKEVIFEYKLNHYKKENGKGEADYVLFGKNGLPIAVVEAKKTATDPVKGRHQAFLYAESIEKEHNIKPVIFYTNGYEIWIWDYESSEPRQIWGFYTHDDLEFLMTQRRNKDKELSKVEIDTNIAGRHYQIEGIKKVYEKFERGGRKALMVMATGTGKTRTVIALTKGMIKTGWVKRVLFLADRDELLNQAQSKKNSFKVFMPDASSIRITADTKNNREATLYFSTYQTMINYYDKFSVGFFDLVICDESHRSIYQTFRDIINYYDAYIIGLTATPVDFLNRNTYSLFDCENQDPTFNYPIEDAWNHVPPYLLEPRVMDATTDFLRRGIKWKNLTEEQKSQLDEQGLSEEVIDFEKEHIEQFITNKDTNKFILQTLMNKGIKVGEYIGKTIIFARNIKHAKFLLELFDEMYYQYKGNLACIIHSDISEKQDLIDRFKEDSFPRIAISVDIMDTGIDVPEIVNLVFAKPVYSKVKFWQMLGRGTRLCENLFGNGKDKEHFIIFDHWKNFEFFEINPEGVTPQTYKTSFQVRFEQRVKLLKVLAEKRMENEKNVIKAFVRDDITLLPVKSIEVKKKRKSLEQLKVENVWNFVNDNLINKLLGEIAPLMLWVNTEEDTDALVFDSQIYRLMNAKVIKALNKIETEINNLISGLSKLKVSLNHFEGKRDLIASLLTPEKWLSSNFDELEEIRLTLRDLMKYKGGGVGKPFISIDVEDVDKIITEKSGSSVLYNNNMEPYEKRVRKAIEEKLNDHIIIHKIRKGQKLSQKEFESIFNVFNLPDFAFTLDELSKNTSIQKDDITSIIRKFIGVDTEELNKKFEEFIQEHQIKMNSIQMKVLEIIKDEISKNKGISFAALFDKPFTNFNKNGIEGIFGKDADELFGLIEPFRANYIS